MMKMEMLFQRAAQIASGGSSTASGRKAKITALELEKRLATYREAVTATGDHEPPCPECWLGHGEELAMALVTCDWPEEHVYGCMVCGFEESIPIRPVRRKSGAARKTARAA